MSERTALITGAGGGIGAVLCREFRAAGYRVIALDVREVEPDAHHFVRSDLALFSRDPQYRARFSATLKGLVPGSGLDVLINNAAVQIIGPTEQLTEDAWRETFDVNVLAPFLLVQCFVSELERARGSVVNIGSIHASLTKPGFACYATSKAALGGLTRSLAVDLGGRVRVNAIAPAAVATPMLEAGFVGRPEAYAELASAHPSGTIGAPDEVARCALFLADPRNVFLTGMIVGLDGGIAARLHDPA